ncbi:MAG: hypothetical protein Fur0021_10450 [Candidatus Promineifilaceae bacterium]
MRESRLMIVMGDKGWTLAALHLACAMSRRSQTALLLLKMTPVRHPLLLGTSAASLSFTAEDEQVLEEMAAAAEAYGVTLDVKVCQYASYWHAVVDAAEQTEATAVLVHVPPSPIPYWRNWRCRHLRRQLARQQRELITLDTLPPSLTWTPSITLPEPPIKETAKVK